MDHGDLVKDQFKQMHEPLIDFNQMRMPQSGWLQDPKTKNCLRFHRDAKSWSQYPKVFIDSGRPLPGQPALLKSRQYLDLLDAKKLWFQLKQDGWQRVGPQWGADMEV